MTRYSQIVIVALLLAVVVMGGVLLARGRQGADSASSNTVIVFAPCGMTGPINAATAAFRKSHPEVQLEVVFDNANILVRRVKDGERPDVFISPGELEMQQLTQEELVDSASIRDFGSLDMVLIAPARAKGLDKIEDLAQPTIKAISLGDPRYNSVGYYGEKALQSLGLWDSLQGKLILREYPLEAVKLVESGRVDAGITYFTCPLETSPDIASKSALRIIEKLPRDKYPPVRLQVGMLKSSQQRELSQRFIEFMASKQTQELLSHNGLLPVGA